MKPWRKVLEWKLPFAKWFVGGKLNVSDNCLDRHVDGPRRNKAAIIWEGRAGRHARTLTYRELLPRGQPFADALKRHGVKKGDRVTIYMPMVPEVGDRHAGLRPHRRPTQRRVRRLLRRRRCATGSTTAQAKVVITADGGWRRGEIVPLKENVDEALKECPQRRAR